MSKTINQTFIVALINFHDVNTLTMAGFYQHDITEFGLEMAVSRR